MAVVQMNNNTSREITPEQGHQLWLVLQGEVDGDAKQQKFALQVKRLYLNWRRPDLPESYYQAHKSAIDELSRMHSVAPPSMSYAQGKERAYRD